MVYGIVANTVIAKSGWSESRGVPSFFLDSSIQGIVDIAHAEKIARDMLELLPEITAYVTAIELPDAVIYPEHTEPPIR